MKGKRLETSSFPQFSNGLDPANHYTLDITPGMKVTSPTCKIVSPLICCMLLLALWVNPALSCVGRILTLTVTDAPDQQLVGRIVATLITERTGTTVNLKSAADVTDGENQLKEKNADITISYLQTGLARLGSDATTASPQEAYGLVKQYYMDELDMVWLKPFGYRGPLSPEDKQAKNGSLAVPVTTKDVLNRFPVLDRVINKLAGKLDDTTLHTLLDKLKKQKLEAVVKDFLKTRNLI